MRFLIFWFLAWQSFARIFVNFLFLDPRLAKAFEVILHYRNCFGNGLESPNFLLLTTAINIIDAKWFGKLFLWVLNNLKIMRLCRIIMRLPDGAGLCDLVAHGCD